MPNDCTDCQHPRGRLSCRWEDADWLPEMERRKRFWEKLAPRRCADGQCKRSEQGPAGPFVGVATVVRPCAGVYLCILLFKARSGQKHSQFPMTVRMRTIVWQREGCQ